MEDVVDLEKKPGENQNQTKENRPKISLYGIILLLVVLLFLFYIVKLVQDIDSNKIPIPIVNISNYSLINNNYTIEYRAEQVCSNLSKINQAGYLQFHPRILAKMIEVYQNSSHLWYPEFVNITAGKVYSAQSDIIIVCSVPMTLCDTRDIIKDKNPWRPLFCYDGIVYFRTTYFEWLEWYNNKNDTETNYINMSNYQWIRGE